MMNDAVSIGSRLVHLAGGGADKDGGSDALGREREDHHSFATFPAGQPMLDDEIDGELLAAFVYDGIRPTFSEDSAAPRGSSSRGCCKQCTPCHTTVAHPR